MTDDVVWHPGLVQPADRPSRGATVWFTGYSGSGKSTLAAQCERALVADGRSAYLLDGDNLRLGLNGDLGFTRADRHESVRRVGHLARLFADAGVVALVPLISPYRDDRDQVRTWHDEASVPFVEVHVATPLAVCEARDPKGLYARARSGRLTHFTGIDDPYEPPRQPELVVGDPAAPLEDSVTAVLATLERVLASSVGGSAR